VAFGFVWNVYHIHLHLLHTSTEFKRYMTSICTLWARTVLSEHFTACGLDLIMSVIFQLQLAPVEVWLSGNTLVSANEVTVYLAQLAV